jgi:hypothetical protein
MNNEKHYCKGMQKNEDHDSCRNLIHGMIKKYVYLDIILKLEPKKIKKERDNPLSIH